MDNLAAFFKQMITKGHLFDMEWSVTGQTPNNKT